MSKQELIKVFKLTLPQLTHEEKRRLFDNTVDQSKIFFLLAWIELLKNPKPQQTFLANSQKT